MAVGFRTIRAGCLSSLLPEPPDFSLEGCSQTIGDQNRSRLDRRPCGGLNVCAGHADRPTERARTKSPAPHYDLLRRGERSKGGNRQHVCRRGVASASLRSPFLGFQLTRCALCVTSKARAFFAREWRVCCELLIFPESAIRQRHDSDHRPGFVRWGDSDRSAGRHHHQGRLSPVVQDHR